MLHRIRLHRLLLVALLLALLLPTPGATAVAPPPPPLAAGGAGINWLQAVTDQLNAGLGGNNPPTPPTFGVNAAVSKACAPDKPAQK